MNEREALLAALRDPAPPAVGWWPPAIGWWLVAALVVALAATVALVALAPRARARRQRAAWRRAAAAELAALRASLAAGGRSDAVLARASVLARRVLLTAGPRREIAPLHGERWLAALDAASGGTAFTRGPGRLLASAPFETPRARDAEEIGAVLDALEALVGSVSRRAAHR